MTASAASDFRSKLLYRYVDSRASENGFYIYLMEFEVKRETKHCYVIEAGGKDKFVLMGAGKRFAYPTIAQARQSFERRKQMQLGYLAAEHDRVKAICNAIRAGTVYDKPKFHVHNAF